MKDLAERILDANHIFMSTHRDPDGDGVGAILALSIALNAIGRKIDIVLPDDCPPRLKFLDPDGWLRTLPKDSTDLGCGSPDLALIIDTHQWDLLGHIGNLVKSAKIPTLFLDHHPVRDNDRTDIYGDDCISSTGELVYHLLRDHLDLPIDKRIAECIYASIAFDTHSFRYIRNSPSPHLVAADLLSRGVDANRVYRHLFASNPVGKIRLMGRLMASVNIEEQEKLAWAGLPLAWINEYNVCEDDIKDAVNCLLEIDGVEVAVLLKQTDHDTVKVSFRSKGLIKIHGMAQRLGGGGHPFASGATLTGDLDSLSERVLGVVLELLRGKKQS